MNVYLVYKVDYIGVGDKGSLRQQDVIKVYDDIQKALDYCKEMNGKMKENGVDDKTLYTWTMKGVE